MPPHPPACQHNRCEPATKPEALRHESFSREQDVPRQPEHQQSRFIDKPVCQAELNPYAGHEIAFLTQHGKEHVVAHVLDTALNCKVKRVDGFDTDELGTFSREIPRYGSQLDTARRKARIGMKLSGASLGLGSEGSFGPDPHTGLFPWNIEVLLLIDDIRKIEVIGIHQGPASIDHCWVHCWTELEAFAHQVGFPKQQLVLRPCSEDDPRLLKGLANWAALRVGFAWAKKLTTGDQKILVERDLRAHAHPERMVNIGKAANNLLEKLRSLCPQCGLPGFSAIEHLPGLPCAVCGRSTREHRGQLWGCSTCNFRQENFRQDGIAFADPSRCDYCNP